MVPSDGIYVRGRIPLVRGGQTHTIIDLKSTYHVPSHFRLVIGRTHDTGPTCKTPVRTTRVKLIYTSVRSGV